jgi:hypothetical protein
MSFVFKYFEATVLLFLNKSFVFSYFLASFRQASFAFNNILASFVVFLLLVNSRFPRAAGPSLFHLGTLVPGARLRQNVSTPTIIIGYHSFIALSRGKCVVSQFGVAICYYYSQEAPIFVL